MAEPKVKRRRVLIARHAFNGYVLGDRITDEEQVAQIIAERPDAVVQTEEPVDDLEAERLALAKQPDNEIVVPDAAPVALPAPEKPVE